MSETITDKVYRYRKEFPQNDGQWYRDPCTTHTCHSCKNTIECDTVYINTRGLYKCEHCAIGVDVPSSPKQVEQPKQPKPPPPPKPTWIINSNGICYHCNVNDCIHTKRAQQKGNI